MHGGQSLLKDLKGHRFRQHICIYLPCSRQAIFAAIQAVPDDDGDTFVVRNLVHWCARISGLIGSSLFLNCLSRVSISAKTRSHLTVAVLLRCATLGHLLFCRHRHDVLSTSGTPLVHLGVLFIWLPGEIRDVKNLLSRNSAKISSSPSYSRKKRLPQCLYQMHQSPTQMF